MWIKIVFVDADEKSLILPVELKKMIGTSAKFIFGGRIVMVNVLSSTKLLYKDSSSFDDPITVYLSKDLKSRLLIPDSQIYKVKIDKNTFFLGPVIGFLMGIHNQDYSPNHMKKYSDRFGIYKKVGGLIYAFSPNSVVWDENKVFGLYFNIKTGKWEYGTFPLPSVIYRRDFHQSEDLINRLKAATDGRLFNSYRFSKWELFKIIGKNSDLAPKLPETEKIVSFVKLKDFVDRHLKVILKPNNLSRGRGICILEKKNEDYIINDYRGKHSFDVVLKGESELLQFYTENIDIHEDYLIQKHINLAKIDGSTFDIRVVMQKICKDTWIHSGVECRVARPNSLITNVSRGGYALELEDALWGAFKDKSIIYPLTKQIYEFCQDICMHLDNIGEHFAEFGLDIGLDEDRGIWLIEANVFPSFKGFKKMDYDKYLKIRYTPLLYALSLTELK